MIKHIVMWNFKNEGEGKTREENMAIVRDRLYALLPIIPEIKKMEIYLLIVEIIINVGAIASMNKNVKFPITIFVSLLSK
jgi:hypothetical protein